jgi:hypothetical protein
VKRLPLLKTPTGWIVMQTAMEQNSEDVYHEDKLAVYISNESDSRGCASTCHLGDGNQSTQKGVHYTDGKIADLWHWKSISGEPFGSSDGGLGQLIDEYIGPPGPVATDSESHYTGGRFSDPGKGGYQENFVKLDSSRPVSRTRVRPIMLPAILKMQLSVDPTITGKGEAWSIHKATGIPYSEKLDRYPNWTVLPNVIVEPLQGDRADVRSKASWQEGRWMLEATRVLDTKSQYDVPFLPGRPVYLSVAAFNRTATRHSEHLRPLRIVLRP